MTNKKFNFYQKWLTYANVFTVIIGLLIAFASNSFLFDIHNFYTKKLLLDGQEYTPEILKIKAWLFGIIGGTIVGFQLMVIMISENAFKEKESWAWWTILLGMTAWFVIDSSLSTFHGAIHNVLLVNLPSYLLICFPLFMTRKVFLQKNEK